jgi:hypothetical protein
VESIGGGRYILFRVVASKKILSVKGFVAYLAN